MLGYWISIITSSVLSYCFNFSTKCYMGLLFKTLHVYMHRLSMRKTMMIHKWHWPFHYSINGFHHFQSIKGSAQEKTYWIHREVILLLVFSDDKSSRCEARKGGSNQQSALRCGVFSHNLDSTVIQWYYHSTIIVVSSSWNWSNDGSILYLPKNNWTF